MDVSSYLIVNRNISKSNPEKIKLLSKDLERLQMLKVINCNNENYEKNKKIP